MIRQSPTFVRWTLLERGEKLRYACREFVKGHGDDEERLMRRIMIARRNNIRDHETLKRARRQTRTSGSSSPIIPIPVPVVVPVPRRPPSTFSDNVVEQEMDVPAVEATRSFRSWQSLPDGAEFVYNQKYIKGRDGHDWLLRKNIWRRMRYRRENKKMVERLKVKGELDHPTNMVAHDGHTDSGEQATSVTASEAAKETAAADKKASNEHNDAATHAAAAAAATSDHLADQEAVEAAVAAAESFGKTAGLDMGVVHNPLDAAEAQEAVLDAAARLAAATSGLDDEEHSLLKEDMIGHSESV